MLSSAAPRTSDFYRPPARLRNFPKYGSCEQYSDPSSRNQSHRYAIACLNSFGVSIGTNCAVEREQKIHSVGIPLEKVSSSCCGVSRGLKTSGEEKRNFFKKCQGAPSP